MKHTFVFIDKIMFLLNELPRRTIETEERKEMARKIFDEINLYTQTLKKLIGSHKEEKYLKRLHATHIAKIKCWADKVSELFKKLDSLLTVLETDIKILKDVIENRPHEWQIKVSNLALGMVQTGLHEEEEEMKRFRNIAIFEMHELKGMISAEHISEIKQVLQLLE